MNHLLKISIISWILFGFSAFQTPSAWPQGVPSPAPSSTSTAPAYPVSITSATGYSNFVPASGATGAIIYGGIVGAATAGGCPGNGTDPCNNCVYNTAAPVACNTRRVYSGLSLTINFTVAANVNGYITVGWSSNGSTTRSGFTTFSPQPGAAYVTQGAQGSVTIPWSEICDDAIGTAGTNCVAAAGNENPITVYISIESTLPAQYTVNSTPVTVYPFAPTGTNLDVLLAANPDPGIIGFYARAGDQKVYIQDVVPQNTCPTQFTTARVYYVQDDGTGLPAQFDTDTYGSTSYQDLALAADCTPSGDWTISGLTNDVGYFFRMSIVDAANNNIFLQDSNYIKTVPASTTCGAAITTPQQDAGCAYYATPSKVAGLLPNNINCFVATATYGSKWAPAVITLREFRNRFLLTNDWGRKFAQAYYEYGPRYAKMIHDNEWLRFASRLALSPIWGFAWLSLYYSPITVLFVMLLVIGFSVVALRRYQRGEW